VDRGDQRSRCARDTPGPQEGVSRHRNGVGPSHANTFNPPRALVHNWGAGRPPKALLQRLRRELRQGGHDCGHHSGWSAQLCRSEPKNLGVHCATTEFMKRHRSPRALGELDLPSVTAPLTPERRRSAREPTLGHVCRDEGWIDPCGKGAVASRPKRGFMEIDLILRISGQG